jgi:hypothetical protein
MTEMLGSRRTWFGNSPLAVQFFELYVIYNEQNKTIAHIWDGSTLMLTFRRELITPLVLQLVHHVKV